MLTKTYLFCVRLCLHIIGKGKDDQILEYFTEILLYYEAHYVGKKKNFFYK